MPCFLCPQEANLHVLLSHHAQSPQLSPFAPISCPLHPVSPCICCVSVHCTVTRYFCSTICSHFCVSGVCVLLLTSDDGCGKQFPLHQDLCLTSLTMSLVAALPLIRWVQELILMFLWHASCNSYSSDHSLLDTGHVQERVPKWGWNICNVAFNRWCGLTYALFLLVLCFISSGRAY